MTESYILYLQTELPVEAVLQIIFEPKTIAPVEGTNLLYARGSVYLAHAQPLPPQMQDRHEREFGFAPTINIRYFPDGVSSVNTAMTLLAEGIVRWIHEANDNFVLATNKAQVIKRQDATLSIKTGHDFWKQNRLGLINMPYSEMA